MMTDDVVAIMYIALYVVGIVFTFGAFDGIIKNTEDATNAAFLVMTILFAWPLAWLGFIIYKGYKLLENVGEGLYKVGQFVGRKLGL